MFETTYPGEGRDYPFGCIYAVTIQLSIEFLSIHRIHRHSRVIDDEEEEPPSNFGPNRWSDMQVIPDELQKKNEGLSIVVNNIGLLPRLLETLFISTQELGTPRWRIFVFKEAMIHVIQERTELIWVEMREYGLVIVAS
jgi:hypothetical protein